MQDLSLYGAACRGDEPETFARARLSGSGRPWEAGDSLPSHPSAGREVFAHKAGRGVYMLCFLFVLGGGCIPHEGTKRRAIEICTCS